VSPYTCFSDEMPLAADGDILLCAGPKGLEVLDIHTGEQKKHIHIIVCSPPAIADGTAYFLMHNEGNSGRHSDEEYLISINVETAERNWKLCIDGPKFFSVKILTAGKYVMLWCRGRRSANLVCVESETGRLAWALPGEGRISPPVLDGETIYVSKEEEGEVLALELISGKELWRARPADRLFTSCALAGECVVVGGLDIYFLDKRSGKTKKVFRTGYHPTRWILVRGEAAYYPGFDSFHSLKYRRFTGE